MRARIEKIQAQNEHECRWNRKQLLDFYTECLERGAGTLTPDDRLCQAVERTTIEHFDGKGKLVRTVTKERLVMPAKVGGCRGSQANVGLGPQARDRSAR